MLQNGTPVAPITTVALGTLAAAAHSATVLRLTHVSDASIMVLVWQIGSVALLIGIAAPLGRKLLPWPEVSDQDCPGQVTQDRTIRGREDPTLHRFVTL